MDNAQWQPTNEPGRYDANRVASQRPIHQTIEHLRLPPIRLRKLNAICNALEMQIEDGGDAPEVNNQLLGALRLAVIHQVGRRRATAVLQVIDNFARAEEARHRRSVQERLESLFKQQQKAERATTSAAGKKSKIPKRKFRISRKRRRKK